MSLSAQRHVVLGSFTNTPPTPVLPAKTIRCKFSSGYTPTMGDRQTLVDAGENIWDIYRNNRYWASRFEGCVQLIEVIASNLQGVEKLAYTFKGCTNLTSFNLSGTSTITDMRYAFRGCTSLDHISLFDTSSVTIISGAFLDCTNVQSGALALYQQASTQTNPPTTYDICFENCGSNTITGAAELAQIPASWGGTGA